VPQNEALSCADLGHGVILALDRTGLIFGSYGFYSHGAATSTLLAAFIVVTSQNCLGFDAAGWRFHRQQSWRVATALPHRFPHG
jgi:hypothetical protein